jgi:hypothetical protein
VTILRLLPSYPMHWSGWGTHIDIPVPPGGTGDVPAWSDLKFNPLGIYNLRRRLGALQHEPGVFMRYKSNFASSDVAWFSAGMHNDGQHMTPRDTYHPLFMTAREHTGTGESATRLRNKLRDSVRDEIFDMVSALYHTVITLSHALALGNFMGSRIWWLHHGPPC